MDMDSLAPETHENAIKKISMKRVPPSHFWISDHRGDPFQEGGYITGRVLIQGGVLIQRIRYSRNDITDKAKEFFDIKKNQVFYIIYC
jgi:hypothetical protein